MSADIQYTAHEPDSDGRIQYSAAEHAVWRTLIQRQRALLPQRACEPYIDAMQLLNFSDDEIPQCADISAILKPLTGWSVTPVPAIIPADDFFALLADKQFPAASFIRDARELDYLEEPDIFHEIFGHAPHLTDNRFGEFTHAYGVAGLAANEINRRMLARLYWFTVEFGLINSDDGLRAYGAGICSSPGELEYALDNRTPERRPFNVLDVLRTPFRIDTYQSIYYVIDSFDALFELANTDLSDVMRTAAALGDYEPTFDDAAYG